MSRRGDCIVEFVIEKETLGTREKYRDVSAADKTDTFYARRLMDEDMT